MGFDFYIRKASEFSDDEVEKALMSFSPYRREIIVKCKKNNDRNLKICASFLLAEGLRKYGIDEKNMQYSVNPFGKPSIDGCNVNFSLSHSGEYAAAAFSYKPIGCDIQRICSVNESIPPRFFTPEENAYLNSSKDKKDSFFRIWTMKESAVKALGLSVANMSEIEITGLDSIPYMIVNNKKFSFCEKEKNGYKISVCILND